MLEYSLLLVVYGRMRISGVSVIRAPNAVHSVLYLVIVFIQGSVRIRIYQVEFIARIFIVVYVGAIAVLFRFVVIILNLSVVEDNLEESEEGLVRSRIRRIGRSGTRIVQEEVNQVWREYIDWILNRDQLGSIQILGQVRYTYGIVYVRLAGIVLLAGIVGAIVLTLQIRTNAISKRQMAYQQRSRDNTIRITNH